MPKFQEELCISCMQECSYLGQWFKMLFFDIWYYLQMLTFEEPSSRKLHFGLQQPRKDTNKSVKKQDLDAYIQNQVLESWNLRLGNM